MKKVFSIILALVMVLGLSACNKNEDKPMENDGTVIEGVDTTTPGEDESGESESDTELTEDEITELENQRLEFDYLITGLRDYSKGHDTDRFGPITKVENTVLFDNDEALVELLGLCTELDTDKLYGVIHIKNTGKTGYSLFGTSIYFDEYLASNWGSAELTAGIDQFYYCDFNYSVEALGLSKPTQVNTVKVSLGIMDEAYTPNWVTTDSLRVMNVESEDFEYELKNDSVFTDDNLDLSIEEFGFDFESEPYLNVYMNNKSDMAAIINISDLQINGTKVYVDEELYGNSWTMNENSKTVTRLFRTTEDSEINGKIETGKDEYKITFNLSYGSIADETLLDCGKQEIIFNDYVQE